MAISSSAMLLEARGLRRAHGERLLFEGLDLALDEGQVLVVRGPSGSGKTALLRVLAGLDEAQQGELSLDGRGFDSWGGARWRARVSYLLQGGPMLGGTPAEIALRVGRLCCQREREALDPEPLARGWGLEREAWTRPWSALSVGERQRAQLAIVVSRQPRVLLLDEPTSALDPDARRAVEESLRGRCAVWVTHDPSQAERVATKVLEIGA